MAIYSRFGCELQIIGDCGEHKAKGYACPVHLVRAIRQDDKATRHYFTHSLRADGGANAIDEAVKLAPIVSVTGAELKAAIYEAS